MSDIICRQCGQKYSRSDFPTGQFYCSSCNWKEMLPAGTRKTVGGQQAKAQKSGGEDTHDEGETVAVAEPEEIRMTPEPAEIAPNDAASSPDVQQEWSLVVQASAADFQLWCGRLLTMFGFNENERSDGAEPDCDLELTRNNEVRFVDCRHLPDGDTVPRRDVQKLAGAMLGRDVTSGMFLTSGTFDDSTRLFVENLPNLAIELIDGTELQQTLHAILCGPLRKWWK